MVPSLAYQGNPALFGGSAPAATLLKGRRGRSTLQGRCCIPLRNLAYRNLDGLGDVCPTWRVGMIRPKRFCAWRKGRRKLALRIAQVFSKLRLRTGADGARVSPTRKEHRPWGRTKSTSPPLGIYRWPSPRCYPLGRAPGFSHSDRAHTVSLAPRLDARDTFGMPCAGLPCAPAPVLAPTESIPAM